MFNNKQLTFEAKYITVLNHNYNIIGTYDRDFEIFISIVKLDLSFFVVWKGQISLTIFSSPCL